VHVDLVVAHSLQLIVSHLSHFLVAVFNNEPFPHVVHSLGFEDDLTRQ